MHIKEKAKRVHQSYIRAGGRSLIATFYDHLMLSDKEIQEKFEQVDMEAQIDNMSRAIVMAFLFTSRNNATALRVVDKVRETHSRDHLDISPHLYERWLERLIETVAVYDPQTDEELLADWRSVMSTTIDHIKAAH